MSLDSALREYRKWGDTPTLFHHAGRELSHEALLAYALEALRRSVEAKTCEADAVRFGAELVKEFFSLSNLPPAFRLKVERQSPRSGGYRPDLLLCVETPGGTPQWAVVETKVSAIPSPTQTQLYADAVRRDKVGNLAASWIYTAGRYFHESGHPREWGAGIKLFGLDEIARALRRSRIDERSVTDHYRTWIEQQVAFEALWNEPELFRTAYKGTGAADEVRTILGDVPWSGPELERRINWAFLLNLVRQTTGRERSDVERLLASDSNSAGRGGYWVQCWFAADKEGAGWVYYRLDSGRLDLRVYGGPARGSAEPDTGGWRARKEFFRDRVANAIGQRPGIRFPGGADYRFQGSAKETSICRFELDQATLPKNFASVHAAIVDAIRTEGSLKLSL